ncbi:class I SAM-dependent DNA methyltransferase [Cyanobacterium stanieri LEGE 03274]|uniref:site-specific DNA-methyltransferase (adenine-specific) n=1 Tax=Cyanobacterium stanieri LEGE 03274 TaxID=1828756 RepID=A0ABR9V6G3_9CHRO|nr:DNA methyltransferase [Cyanobacterium stanieri]MBE9223485.1 class I SAM-dependent DNA methyltransferase [Cyanobacterium stanieri LEGE 03274]
MTDNHQENLEKFIQFCQQHITGQERKEAQIFLDRFFQAFGYNGALEAGAKYEEAIKKGSKKKNTGFADLVWKPKLLIEMKKRGEDLNKHYAQAFEYWSRLVPNRPRYVILSNFDEFWIFDFDLQLDEPVDIISLEELPQRYSAFNFMLRGDVESIFKNNQVDVTEKAGRRLGELFQILQKRLNPSPPAPNSGGDNENCPPAPNFGGDNENKTLKIQRFILQCVLAMFAEDRGLLPNNLFIRCVEECINGASSYDVLGGLFREMNNRGVTPAGKYQGVEYFNGGLFATVEAIELTKPELEILATVARQDWSKVRPAIFGNIFEGTVNAKERHSYGMHYTSEADIMKIVRPTISKYWEDLIDNTNTIKDLSNLQLQLQSYKILDPACGSGNFLYVAYQELKRIEQLLLDKIRAKSKKQNVQQNLGFVTPNQFYGMDVNPFAVELAKVTLMIARKVAIDKLGLTEPALPLDSLDQNILCTDALFSPWVKADTIIGNPPFLGGKHMRLNLTDDYVEKIFSKFKDVKDSVDFCCYWFRIAHDNLGENGRAGLVATNSISQGKSRRASLDYILQNKGIIHEAISTQEWSGEAAVHVSIVNWSKSIPNNYFLDNKQVKQINSSLTSLTDVSQAKKLKINKNICFQGVSPVGMGFIITEKQAQEFIKADSNNKKVIKLFSMGDNLASNPHGIPNRWIIDFANLDVESASDYKLPFQYVKDSVKPERDKNRMKMRRLNWWKMGVNALTMRKSIDNLSFCFAVPRVSKWAIFIPFNTEWLAGDLNCVIASDDFYILGVLTSKIHRLWVKAQSSTLKGDTRYTNTSCFETFPFPSPPAPLPKGEGSKIEKKVSFVKGNSGGSKTDLEGSKILQQIRDKMTELHEYRTEQMEKKQWGITQLYNAFFDEPSSKLYKLHQQLDDLVMKAYGFDEDGDILEQLLELNGKMAEN